MQRRLAFAGSIGAWVVVLSLIGSCKSKARPSPAPIGSQAQPSPAPIGSEARPSLPNWTPRPLDPSLSAQLASLVAEIANADRVESAHVGLVGTPSDQWGRYEQLRELASVEQLIG
jgi:hypothetical protein